MYLAAVSVVLAIPCLRIVLAGGGFMPGIHPFLEFRHLPGRSGAAGGGAWDGSACVGSGFSALLGWGRWIAPISYALYIAHEPLFSRAHYFRGLMPAPIEKAAYLACLLAFCVVTELWLYRRIIRPAEK